ncbi:sigma-70 family RNA polymerase sigma factor [Gracilibacillus dipsosauri]|uniref:RNA polymerase sigma factor 70 region 4 type 2 domain-containing protein n=1 Tax=Gracilibacillus dipsosauri TaxID=178340 RepID=A0A317KY37_9BACI|nr:sigma-70 family RNA polymerase sigma factor [Gracilibacillus dipsosauri]PWU66569.1 hypothetical protein DLJ74_19290 [Gracilibacillus dipsosauri]
MNDWAEKMIIQYEEGRKELRHKIDNLGDSETDKMDKSQINSMVSEMSFVIDWLKNGREPGKLRGIDKSSAYQLDSIQDMDMFPTLNIKPTQRELTEEEKRDIFDVLLTLSPRERQCFILHESYLRTFAEIAEELGLSRSSVQRYIERARKKISCHAVVVPA